MTKSLAVEWGQFGIRVNAVAPGATKTPRTLKMNEKYFNAEFNLLRGKKEENRIGERVFT